MSDLRRHVSDAFYDPDTVPVRDPLQELAYLAGLLKQALHACGMRVNKLEEVRYSSAMGLEQVRAELEMFERFSRVLAAVLSQLQKSNLVDRVLDARERYSDIVAEMFNMTFRQIELSDKQQSRLAEIMPTIVEYIDPKIAKRDGYRVVDGEIVLLTEEIGEPEGEPRHFAESMSQAQSEALIDGVEAELQKNTDKIDKIPGIRHAQSEVHVRDDAAKKSKARFEMLKKQAEANQRRAEEREERMAKW